jgi:hypothetical protein
MIFEQKNVINLKCVVAFCTNIVWSISLSKKNETRYDQKMDIGLYVKYRLFLSDINETYILWQTFEKCSHIKFHGKSFRREPCRSMRMDWQTDG